MKDKSIERYIKDEAFAHVKQVNGSKACYDSYIAGRTKGIEREKELEDGLRWIEAKVFNSAWHIDTLITQKIHELIAK